jgi:hypothetical protein
MKRIIAMLVIAALALMLGGCAAPTTESPSATEEKPTTTTEKPADPKKDFDGTGQAETGEGAFYITTAAGTSENGNAPALTIMADTKLMQIGYFTDELDGVPVTYIYLDGMLAEKGNKGTSQGQISLEGDGLKVGEHTVEAVQFANDDPSGEVTFYRSAMFSIKN